jgi:hypothetical protein
VREGVPLIEIAVPLVTALPPERDALAETLLASLTVIEYDEAAVTFVTVHGNEEYDGVAVNAAPFLVKEVIV